MKKLIGFMLVILCTISFTGCFKSEEIEDNKIKAPSPSSVSIEGIWEISTQYKISEKGKLDKLQEIEKVLVSIKKNSVSIQNIEISNPKFKFKRVKKADYLSKEIQEITTDIEEKDGFMEIMSISDNSNLFIDFIKVNENKGYIYTIGEFLVVEKVHDGVKSETTTNSNSIITKFENKKGQDNGVLLGIKEPATMLDNGEIIPAKYKTLWIYSENGKIKEPKIIDGVLLPRANGGFTHVNMAKVEDENKSIESLNITTQNKNGKIEAEKKSENESYREISFLGKDYIGLQYYDSLKMRDFENYKLLPVDTVENKKGIDIEEVYGTKGKEAYETSKSKFLASKEEEFLENYDLKSANTRNVTVVRKNGKWVLEGNIAASKEGVQDTTFDIDLLVSGTLVNWDNLPMNWNKLKEIIPDAKDAISSPISDFIVILKEKTIDVYEMKDLNEKSKPVASYPISENSSVVMGEWAIGNEFTTSWTKAVEEKSK